jgi:hypothetical protein
LPGMTSDDRLSAPFRELMEFNEFQTNENLNLKIKRNPQRLSQASKHRLGVRRICIGN